MSSNLPPGVTPNMIPGNRPEDFEAERLTECLRKIRDIANPLHQHDPLFVESCEQQGVSVERASLDTIFQMTLAEFRVFCDGEDCDATESDGLWTAPSGQKFCAGHIREQVERGDI